jgi:hypothetical protein
VVLGSLRYDPSRDRYCIRRLLIRKVRETVYEWGASGINILLPDSPRILSCVCVIWRRAPSCGAYANHHSASLGSMYFMISMVDS